MAVVGLSVASVDPDEVDAERSSTRTVLSFGTLERLV